MAPLFALLAGTLLARLLGLLGVDALDAWWQLVGAAAWAYLDETGRPVDIRRLAVPDPAPDRSPG